MEGEGWMLTASGQGGTLSLRDGCWVAGDVLYYIGQHGGGEGQGRNIV